MDTDSLAAIREAALDYFSRSGSIRRCRAFIEGGDGADGTAIARTEAWGRLVALGWPGKLAPEAVGGLDFDLAGALHRDLALQLPHDRGVEVPSLRSPCAFRARRSSTGPRRCRARTASRCWRPSWDWTRRGCASCGSGR